MSVKQLIQEMEGEDDFAKDLVDRLLKDGEFDVPLTTEEDAIFLTDRWGGTDDGNDLSVQDQAAVERLQPFIFQEQNFIVKRNGVFGMLFEWEFINPDSAEASELTSAWGNKVPTFEEAIRDLKSRAERIRQADQTAEVYITVGPHTFNDNITVRAFIPNPTGVDQIAKISKAMWA